MAFIFQYRSIPPCRFKRQISDKPQCEGSEAPTKPQYIERYAKNSPVFGVEIKYRAVEIYSFAESTITEKDREILKLRMEGYTEQEIADKVGYKTASAVHKRIAKIADAYEDFVTAEYQKYLG